MDKTNATNATNNATNATNWSLDKTTAPAMTLVSDKFMLVNKDFFKLDKPRKGLIFGLVVDGFEGDMVRLELKQIGESKDE